MVAKKIPRALTDMVAVDAKHKDLAAICQLLTPFGDLRGIFPLGTWNRERDLDTVLASPHIQHRNIRPAIQQLFQLGGRESVIHRYYPGLVEELHGDADDRAGRDYRNDSDFEAPQRREGRQAHE